jgi:hypothetical protein
MDLQNYYYINTPVDLLPDAPIIPNINSLDSPPELNTVLSDILDYKNNIPTITILDNKTVQLNGLLSKIKPTTTTYKKFLSGLRSAPTFPDTLDLRDDLGPVRDQGTLGSCVSFASSAMKEWQEKKEGTFTGYLSPAYIYVNRINNPEEGMYLSDACDILANKGVCSEVDYSYNEFVLNKSPNTIKPTSLPPSVVKEANRYRTSNSVLVQTINDLKTALYLHGPCIIGTLVYYPMNKRMWVPTDPNDRMTNLGGGHCMVVVGYNTNGFIIRNSWGPNWNPTDLPDMMGHDYLPYEDFKYATTNYDAEIWSTTDLIQQNIDDILVDPEYVIPPTPAPLPIVEYIVVSNYNTEIILGVLLGAIILFNIVYFLMQTHKK